MYAGCMWYARKAAVKAGQGPSSFPVSSIYPGQSKYTTTKYSMSLQAYWMNETDLVYEEAKQQSSSAPHGRYM